MYIWTYAVWFSLQKRLFIFFLIVCKGCTKAAYPPYLDPSQWPWELDGVSEWYWHPNWWSFLVEGWHWSCKVCFLGEKQKKNTTRPDFGWTKNTNKASPFGVVFIHFEGSMNVFQLLFRKNWHGGNSFFLFFSTHPTETLLLLRKKNELVCSSVWALKETWKKKHQIQNHVYHPSRVYHGKPKNTHKNPLYGCFQK